MKDLGKIEKAHRLFNKLVQSTTLSFIRVFKVFDGDELLESRTSEFGLCNKVGFGLHINGTG